MSADADHGNLPAWIALVTLPPVLGVLGAVGWLHSVGFTPLPAFTYPSAALAVPWADMVGLLVAGLGAVVVGPHLVLLASLFGLSVAWGFDAWTGVNIGTEPSVAIRMLYSASLLGTVSALGVSAGGGAPGLRYASMVTGWAAWALGPLTALGLLRLAAGAGYDPFVVALPLLIGGLFPVFIATVSWWLLRRHPRPPAAEASRRVAAVALIGVFVVAAVHLVDLLRQAHIPSDMLYSELPPTTIAHGAALLLTAAACVPALLLLQVLGRQSRFGVAAGIGAAMAAIAAVWAWSGEGGWPLVVAAMAGSGHALVLPWVWARASSDAHWRLAGPLACAVLLAPSIATEFGELVQIAAAMTLALGALPLSTLGWVGDEWIFGDEPGSSADRRYRRR